MLMARFQNRSASGSLPSARRVVPMLLIASTYSGSISRMRWFITMLASRLCR
jgi:hypothetical protein